MTPAPHPQPEYIITKEMINRILYALQGEEYREVHKILSDARPYHSEAGSAEVLDKLEKRLKGLVPSDIDGNIIGDILKWIKELRQERENRPELYRSAVLDKLLKKYVNERDRIKRECQWDLMCPGGMSVRYGIICDIVKELEELHQQKEDQG